MSFHSAFKKTFLPLFLGFIFFPLCSFANYKDIQAGCSGMECFSPQTEGMHGIVVLTGGVAWATAGESQSFVDDDSTYDYDNDSSSQTVGLWGGMLGGEIGLYPSISLQLGIAYYQMWPLTAQGKVTQGVDSTSSDTFNYQYNITTHQYLLQGKLLGYFLNEWLHPYFIVGIGASFNQVDDYDVTVNKPTFSPKFDSNSSTSFSYNVGFGFDYDVFKYMRIGVGYLYSNFGTANLGDGHINTEPISPTLGQSNLYAQEVIAQLTFLI